MDYRVLAIVAMIAYGLFNYGIKLTTSDLSGVSVLLVSNFTVFVPAVVYILYSGVSVSEAFTTPGPWILGLVGGFGFAPIVNQGFSFLSDIGVALSLGHCASVSRYLGCKAQDGLFW